ncbi:hypothetical protein Clacol_005133 [Clathrus columnatus]|uniref:PX domain-containing protein n=1 Tax=Clathrus columnatus TaxID=1419009 RepID=A0AAV5A9A3_9AGAM|nr:hypothetical protein Clacol_005133 [Clathrus columnatus]
MRAQSSSSSTVTTSDESYEHSSTSSTPSHPFANSKSLLVIIPQDRVDVEEESALYDELNRREFRGTTFHILKRYSDFVQLAIALRQTLPVNSSLLLAHCLSDSD